MSKVWLRRVAGKFDPTHCRRSRCLRVIVPTDELLQVLTLPDFDRVGAIRSHWANPETRTFAELLIDAEEDKALRAVLVGMLRESELGR